MRKERGITLLALTITIIVTLILTGATVTIVLNGEMFKTGKDAKDKTKLAIEKEEKIGAVAENSTTDQLVSKYSDKVTDLTGTIWEFKDNIIYNSDLQYDITGIVYNDSHRYNYTGIATVQAFGYYVFCWNLGSDHPYENEYAFAFIPSNDLGYPNAWVWGSFKTNYITLTNTPTLEITGGDDVKNPELIAWLNENAIKQ